MGVMGGGGTTATSFLFPRAGHKTLGEFFSLLQKSGIEAPQFTTLISVTSSSSHLGTQQIYALAESQYSLQSKISN